MGRGVPSSNQQNSSKLKNHAYHQSAPHPRPLQLPRCNSPQMSPLCFVAPQRIPVCLRVKWIQRWRCADESLITRRQSKAWFSGTRASQAWDGGAEDIILGTCLLPARTVSSSPPGFLNGQSMHWHLCRSQRDCLFTKWMKEHAEG